MKLFPIKKGARTALLCGLSVAFVELIVSSPRFSDQALKRVALILVCNTGIATAIQLYPTKSKKT
jgi:hypothetical protein